MPTTRTRTRRSRAEDEVDPLDDGGPRPAVATKKEAVDRTDDPVRMYLREMGAVELLQPRGRDRHRQAHRGRPRHDDLGPVRKPDHLQRDHRMVERPQRRHDAAARDPRSRGDAVEGPDRRADQPRARKAAKARARSARRPPARPSRKRKSPRKRPPPPTRRTRLIERRTPRAGRGRGRGQHPLASPRWKKR